MKSGTHKASRDIGSELVQCHFYRIKSQGLPRSGENTLFLDGRNYSVTLLGHRYKEEKNLWSFFSVYHIGFIFFMNEPTSRKISQAAVENISF